METKLKHKKDKILFIHYQDLYFNFERVKSIADELTCVLGPVLSMFYYGQHTTM